jgi:hypothetical protein
MVIAHEPPVDLIPAALSPFPPTVETPLEYPDVDQSVGPLPEDNYWPRRLPPADIPMSYAE